ncbi:MAG: adenylate/guanylate cyclase domain-containing protein [Acidimicrobiales bacterium]
MSDRGERIGSGAWSALAIHATVYVAVNGLLVACWVLFGGGSANQLPTVLTSLDAARAQGFWPLYVMVFWGAALVIHLGVVVATAPGRHRRRKERRRQQRRRAEVQATVVSALPDGVLTDAALAGIRLTDGDKAARRVARATDGGRGRGRSEPRGRTDGSDRSGRADRSDRASGRRGGRSDGRTDEPVEGRSTPSPRIADPAPPPVPSTMADAAGADGEHRPVRRWVAVLFTDVVESTSLNQRLGDDAWAELLADHRRVVRAAVAAHEGVEVGTQGDGFLLRFESPEDAVRCAAALQTELASARDRGDALEVRMGVHAGEVVHHDGDDVVGTVVNLAARVTDSAGPGEILVTEPVADHLPDDVVLVDRGLRQLKGFDRPRHLLAVVWQPGADHIELAEDPSRVR